MTLVPFQRDEGFFYFQKFSVQKSFKEEIKWQKKEICRIHHRYGSGFSPVVYGRCKKS